MDCIMPVRGKTLSLFIMTNTPEEIERPILQLFQKYPQNKYSVQDVMRSLQEISRYKIEYRLKKLANRRLITCHKRKVGIVIRYYWQLNERKE
ncbi:hypothetical protein YEEN111655_18875 [Yersinia entomophaga]